MKFFVSFTGKLFSNWNQAPTANLLKAACKLLVSSNETSSNLACFILLQLGNILSSREGQNLSTKRARGFRKLRAAHQPLKSPALPDGAELYKTGTISNKWLSELRVWSNSSCCLPAAEDKEGRTWNFKDTEWRLIQTKLQGISTAEEWFSPEYYKWIRSSPFFIQVCGYFCGQTYQVTANIPKFCERMLGWMGVEVGGEGEGKLVREMDIKRC